VQVHRFDQPLVKLTESAAVEEQNLECTLSFAEEDEERAASCRSTNLLFTIPANRSNPQRRSIGVSPTKISTPLGIIALSRSQR
jgi:hypothetical protein